LLIPDEVRMKYYSENLIGGLARYVLGPPQVKLALEAFVVILGFLILAGAVNTAIIGSNGVLKRVAEDGVMPDWFLKPHPRYGTSHRLLYLILGFQLAIILISHGDIVLLGEAYAFGVVWSFVFMALAMVVLRFKDRQPREFKVPLNFRIGVREIPIGLILIFLILLVTALLNLFTKEVATVGGLAFTVLFLTVFTISEHYHEKRRRGAAYEHLEQFNRQTAEQITAQDLGLRKTYRKLVAIRSPQSLFVLDRALAETDPETTNVVVILAKQATPGVAQPQGPELDTYDRQLFTAVVERAERAGKEVKPVIVLTNNPLYALLKAAWDLHANELILGASNKYTADEQLEQLGFYWVSMQDHESRPLTVRIVGPDRDVYLDLNGGSRIPKISERRARSAAELRAAGAGVRRVLLVHDGTQASRDLFQSVLTMLDPHVPLTLLLLAAEGAARPQGPAPEQTQARRIGRELQVLSVPGELREWLVRLIREGQYDLLLMPWPPDLPPGQALPEDSWQLYVLRQAPCEVLLAAPPTVPLEMEG
ncbi:MAG TPA: amino acid permease, partial [Gemmataceae bacterium]|nr:amino acid permease [Gemmataceae bacterium]